MIILIMVILIIDRIIPLLYTIKIAFKMIVKVLFILDFCEFNNLHVGQRLAYGLLFFIELLKTMY